MVKLEINGKRLPSLYHVSQKNINGVILTPRVPDNEFIKWGIEDGKTKRVSFAKSIGKCLMGLGRNLLGQEFYVFEPDTSHTSEKVLLEHLVVPTKEMVPDCHITKEVWITCPVKLKYKMMIKVTKSSTDHKLVVHRKDTDEDVTTTLHDWEYERVLTPVEEVQEIFSKIKYGLRDPKTNKPWRDTHDSTTENDYNTQWRLATPEQTIKCGVGNCYDTVAISREYLKKAKKIQTRTFFMVPTRGKFFDEPTHTFLIYWDTDDYWKWLEGSWGPFKHNDWQTKDPKELIKWIGTAMANMEKTEITVYELSTYPKYGCSMPEFEKECRKGSVVMKCKPENTHG